MPDLSRAPSDVVAFVRQVVQDYEPELVNAGVTVGVLLALATDKEHEGEEGPPYLRHNGYPAAATAEKNSLKNRLKGAADATIVIDHEHWRGLDEDERVALIHHEARHLEVCRDDNGVIELDKANRPKLNIRLHDLVIGGFRSIISQHGIKAPEAKQLAAIFGHYRQAQFLWSSDMETQDEVPEGSVIAGSLNRA